MCFVYCVVRRMRIKATFVQLRTFTISHSLLKDIRQASKGTKLRNKPTFVDSKRITVRGGAGGSGFPKYGGVGGKGGNVLITADKTADLKNLQLRYSGECGENSRKHFIMGKPGEDTEIMVPPGVVAKTTNGSFIGELDEEGQKLLVAEGGIGGCEATDFNGLRGESRTIILDLKLIADVGLVGFPNAGKSTFLNAISKASPKIADYPFTTIQPQIGMMEYSDFRQISVADLPGLIEGAHKNLGKGHRFLKHIERTKLILMIVDVKGFQLDVKHFHRTAFETILLLNKELECYNKDMLNKPALLALNKLDLDPSHKETEEAIRLVEGLPDTLSEIDASFHPSQLVKFDGVFTMTAKDNKFVDSVKDKIRERLDYYDTQTEEWKSKQIELKPHKTFPSSLEQSRIKFV